MVYGGVPEMRILHYTREATRGTAVACNECGFAPDAPLVVSSYTGRGPFLAHVAVRMRKTRKGSNFGERSR